MTDPRIDAYIERQADFARPILTHLRATVHRACPAAEETLKWSMPSFVHRGKILATMAAFQRHATFGFWRGDVAGAAAKDGAMGQMGRITSIADLPPEDELVAMIAKAAALIDSGAKPPRPAKAPRPAPEVPGELAAALAQVPDAQAHFDAFSAGRRREYLEWVLDAKRPETRAKRIATAVAQIAEGKPLHWKYANC